MGELKWIMANAQDKDNRNTNSSPTSLAHILNNVSIDDSRAKSKSPSSCFSNLSPSSAMLLLTPYLHLPPPISPPDVQMDPFEPFGRKLCQFHGEVKHVPYVAKRGMTYTHKKLIRESGAVLVVICDSSASDQYHGEERLDQVDDQEKFANEVGKMATKCGKPIMLLVVALNGGGKKYYGSKLEVRTWDTLEESAEKVFSR